MFLNKAIIVGNLTRDPELRTLPSGIKVCSFGVATNRFWRDKNGLRQEDTQYHNVVVFGTQAENVAQYLKKGSMVMAEGRMQTRSWDAPDGSKRYRTEIVAERIQFGPRSSASPSGGPASPPGEVGTEAVKAGGELKTSEYPTEEINPDDIPF